MRTTILGPIKGYASILHSFARELPAHKLAQVSDDAEAAEMSLQIGQWLDYSALFAEPAARVNDIAIAVFKVCAKSNSKKL